MTALLDVNVLVALAWPNHVHHRAAHEWFESQPGGWATTPVTELGFVRVSSNHRIIEGAVAPADALAVLAAMCEQPGHEFWADATRLVDAPDPLARPVTHRQVTDAHLLALAADREGMLCTFDRGVAALAGARRDELVILLGAAPGRPSKP